MRACENMVIILVGCEQVGHSCSRCLLFRCAMYYQGTEINISTPIGINSLRVPPPANCAITSTTTMQQYIRAYKRPITNHYETYSPLLASLAHKHDPADQVPNPHRQQHPNDTRGAPPHHRHTPRWRTTLTSIRNFFPKTKNPA